LGTSFDPPTGALLHSIQSAAAVNGVVVWSSFSAAFALEHRERKQASARRHSGLLLRKSAPTTAVWLTHPEAAKCLGILGRNLTWEGDLTGNIFKVSIAPVASRLNTAQHDLCRSPIG
jgi:hypothetical protein